LNQAMLRTSLATDKVRFVGEPIVAIVTEHPYQGEDAAERVLATAPCPVLTVRRPRTRVPAAHQIGGAVVHY
jgi:CO/xanthine dehydrogenase Mo-binding subunit